MCTTLVTQRSREVGRGAAGIRRVLFFYAPNAKIPDFFRSSLFSLNQILLEIWPKNAKNDLYFNRQHSVIFSNTHTVRHVVINVRTFLSLTDGYGNVILWNHLILWLDNIGHACGHLSLWISEVATIGLLSFWISIFVCLINMLFLRFCWWKLYNKCY